MKRSIIWEPWKDPIQPLVNGRIIDPIRPDDDEADPAFHVARNSFGKSSKSHDELEDCDRSRVYTGPAFMGPFGIVPMFESTLPSRLFNFWMGHTNFGITYSIKGIFEGVPGVETLDIHSPYRFRLGIGRHFRAGDVMSAIEEAVQSPEYVAAVAHCKRMRAYYPFCMAGRLRSGQPFGIGGKTQAEVEQRFKNLDSPVVVATSWSNK